MKQLIFIVGLSNGGKTTTIKAFLKLFGKNRIGTNIKINEKYYQVRDYSNCDVGWDEFIIRVNKFKVNKNLLYPLCLDIKNKENNYTNFNQIIDFIDTLKKEHDIYFFIIKNGKNNKSLKEEYIDFIKEKYDLNKINIIDNTLADNSIELKKFIENL